MPGSERNAMSNRRNIVVVGASAGGVQALSSLFENLPHSLRAAIFVVLHIPPSSHSALHCILARKTGLRVEVGRDGETIREGTVYVASADRHLMIGNDGIRLTRGPKESRARPAIDVLFRSAATQYSHRVIGVVLTGELDDGTAGLWAIKDRGGLAFVQDPGTAEHSSMPQSAIAHVNIDFVGPVEALSRALVEAVDSYGKPSTPGSKDAQLEIENAVAMNGRGVEAGVMELGRTSKYTCPDCHGVLIQIEDGPITRFRCHTGHAFSIKSLIAEVNDSIDIGLWDTLRAIEERMMLLRQMAVLADASNASGEARLYRQQADETEQRLKPLRELVLDPHFFGHDAAD